MWDAMFMPWGGAAAAEGGEGGGPPARRGPREAPGELLWSQPTRPGRELAAALARRPGDPPTFAARDAAYARRPTLNCSYRAPPLLSVKEATKGKTGGAPQPPWRSGGAGPAAEEFPGTLPAAAAAEARSGLWLEQLAAVAAGGDRAAEIEAKAPGLSRSVWCTGKAGAGAGADPPAAAPAGRRARSSR